MTESTIAAETAAARSAPDQSLPARIFGVLLTPRATYAGVAARPRVLGILLFVLLFGAAAIFLFLSTEVGKNAMLDNQVEQMKSFGMNVTEQMIDRLEQGADRQRYFAVAGQMVALPLFAAIIAGLALAIFNAVMGGDASFKQVYAIVVHSGVVFSFSQLFTLPLSYAREKMSSATNLGVFAPVPRRELVRGARARIGRSDCGVVAVESLDRAGGALQEAHPADSRRRY
jgi:hypothetical protein